MWCSIPWPPTWGGGPIPKVLAAEHTTGTTLLSPCPEGTHRALVGVSQLGKLPLLPSCCLTSWIDPPVWVTILTGRGRGGGRRRRGKEKDEETEGEKERSLFSLVSKHWPLVSVASPKLPVPQVSAFATHSSIRAISNIPNVAHLPEPGTVLCLPL